MRKIKISLLWAMICMLNLPLDNLSAQDAGRVDMLSHHYAFSQPTPAAGKLGKTIQNGTFKTQDPKNGFSIKMNVDLKKFDGQQNLLEIPDVLSIYLRRMSPSVRDNQNYATFKMADGSLPVLEAKIRLIRPEYGGNGDEMVIGFPLGMLKESYGKHEVILNFTGPKWTMYVDGELVDNEFPLGYPKWDSTANWSINPKYTESAEIFMSPINAQKDVARDTKRPYAQYWTPTGHNSWVGDVATLYHDGRFHVFYLYDRRHHASKLGRGAHYFEHLSTTDFKTWTEHEAATPIEEQWETFGTGTPFVVDGKLCISYGLHTSRLYPEEKTMYPALKVHYENYGKTGSFNYNSFPTVPSGTTYSVSQNGISDFVKSKKIIHYCENPTIYTDEKGKLTMLASYRAKGMWQSDSLDGGWYCVNRDFPPGGDCTFYFRWGKFDYIIGGFVDLWSKPTVDSEYQSITAQGEDFYNGINVPAITEINNGRFLMSGWLPIRGWGGPLIIHEMIQYPDGRIGTKWMNELVPNVGKPKLIASQVADLAHYNNTPESFMLTFDVVPTNKGGEKCAVSFLGAEGSDKGCEFQLRPNDKVAQYSYARFDKFADSEKSLRQGGAPQGAHNYAIEKLIDSDKPFQVRMLVSYNEKIGGVLIDAEIGANRTMITYRPDLKVSKLMFKSDGAEIKNINISPVQ